MKDLETINHLQVVIESLANGVNWYTGECASDDDIVSDVKLVRSLFAVSEVLKELTATQQPRLSTKKRKVDFCYDEDKISKVRLSPTPISLSTLSRIIKVAYDYECRLNYYTLGDMLVQEGILIRDESAVPKLQASASAKEHGIWSEMVWRRYGERMYTFYNENGQRYVLELLKKYYPPQDQVSEKSD